jgi:tetratricopeptide (TPR) repeat protein
MEFYAVLGQVIDLLRQRGRVTYRALKLQFGLDDDQLEALKEELLYAQQRTVDEANRVLVWVDAPGTMPTPTPAVPASVSAPPSSTERERAALAYTPPHLAEKILTSIGKTRLFHEFTQASHTQGWLLLESSSTSYGKATPYLPLIDLLKAYFQIENRDDERRIREKLTKRLLALDAAFGPSLPAFLALLEVPVEDPHWQALEPAQRRQRTLDACKRLLQQSQVQPLLLVVENLHWLDTETQACLDGLVESLPAARLLLLVNYRPEYAYGWHQKTYYTQLRLDPLPPASAVAMLRSLLGDDVSLAPLEQRMIEWTQGNPFFLEESVRTLVETQVLVGSPGAYHLAKALPSIQVPATVQAVLAARIDRLPPEEKQLLHTAAVIGTEVPLALLQTIVEVPEEILRLSLAHLQAAEFLYETHLFPDIEYTFKHALTQQVAYEMLLQERRRTLHVRIVDALESLAGEGLRPAPTQPRQWVAEQVERLAHHALRGEVWGKALTYCQQALSALQRLPEQRHTLEQGIDLRLTLRSALHPSGEFGRIVGYLWEAEALAMALDDHRRLAQISIFLSVHFYYMSTHDQAIAFAQRALALATAYEDVALQAVANQYLGFAYHAQGDYRRALTCFEQTVTSLDGAQRHERFGQVIPPAVLSRSGLVWCHAELAGATDTRTRLGNCLCLERRPVATARNSQRVSPRSMPAMHRSMSISYATIPRREGEALSPGTPPAGAGQ